jgi:hypothetical protein
MQADMPMPHTNTQAARAEAKALKARQGEAMAELCCAEAANAQAARDHARKEGELAARIGEIDAVAGERSALDDKVRAMQMENGACRPFPTPHSCLLSVAHCTALHC